MEYLHDAYATRHHLMDNVDRFSGWDRQRQPLPWWKVVWTQVGETHTGRAHAGREHDPWHQAALDTIQFFSSPPDTNMRSSGELTYGRAERTSLRSLQRRSKLIEKSANMGISSLISPQCSRIIVQPATNTDFAKSPIKV